MTKVTASHGVAAMLVLASLLHAQVPGDATNVPETQFIRLDYATFDPTAATPEVPPALRGGPDTNLWIVQTLGLPHDGVREAIKSTGAQIHSYLPDEAYVVRMNSGQAAQVAGLHTMVRWVGYYEPAYRLEPALLAEIRAGQVAEKRRYNMLVVDKRADKPGLEAKILGLGGSIWKRHEGSPLFTVELDGMQLLAVARCDEVLFIDRWTPNTDDMNHARIQGGGNYVEAQGGYTGNGVIGHIHEGVEAAHPDFNTPLTQIFSACGAAAHGHCTAGIVFGNGASHANARGMAPDAVGFFTNHGCPTYASRNAAFNTLVNTHHVMFTTASWGAAQTTAYTTVSAEADDVVFDHRIPWTNSMSNLGNQNVRPEAWSKNIISIGGLDQQDNSNPADDVWVGASVGPALDGRQKPDLCAYYLNVWTSDLSGASGYNTAAGVAGNYTTGFNGTSSATPIVAGHNALAIQMYTDGIFGNTLPASPTVANRFTNRPFAQTLKALMICGAAQYNTANALTQRRHQGWGFPNLQNLYDFRNRIFIVPEDEVISQGQTDSYTIRVSANTPELKVCMTYLDPQGNPAAAIDRINDLSLRVTSPTGTVYRGNVGLVAAGGLGNNYSSSGGAFNTVDTVENVFVQNPVAGHWTVEVVATLIAQDGHVATGAVDSTYALVVYGGNHIPGASCNTYVPSSDPTTGTCNLIPFGTSTTTTLSTVFAQNNQGSVGGAVYFDVNVTNGVFVNGLSLNTGTLPVGAPIMVQVWRKAGSYVGALGNIGAWTPMTMGFGSIAAVNTPSDIALNSPFYLAPGSHGIAVVAYGFGHFYTNGANNYSDANIAITTGAASNAPFDGAPFSPRTVNMDLRYHANVASNSWNNIRYQTIVRQKELVSGPITGLAFANCGTGRHWNDSLLIRMSHVPAGHVMSTTSFSTNLPTPVTVLDVNDYSWHTTANTWAEVGLQNAFNYNGTSDLVIDIVARGNFHTAGTAFHRDSTIPRVYATGWTGATPTAPTGNDTAAAKIRLQQGCANAHEYGWSCGTLVADHVGQPVLGQNFSFRCQGAPANNFMFLNLGFGNAPPTYPFNLAFIALPGCDLFHEIFATVSTFANGVGTATYTYNFPPTPAGVGFKFYGQWITPDSAAPGDFAVSNYVRMLCGNTP